MRQCLRLAVILLGVCAQSTAFAASDPTGKGDPERTACRRAHASTGSNISTGRSVCLKNAQWLALHEQNKTMSADGKQIIDANGSPFFNPPGQYIGLDRDMAPRGDVSASAP